MPAIRFWSRSRPLICIRLPASSAAKASLVNDASSGSGPSRAMPGTSCGSRTTYTASDFFVPASVRSNPLSSSSATRSAIGLRPGLMSVVGRVSYQRSQPALARWKIRCRSSPRLRSMNLPWRREPVIVAPCSAVICGSNVFSAAMAATLTRVTVRPTARSPRKSTSPCTSGISGMPTSCHGHRTDRRGSHETQDRARHPHLNSLRNPALPASEDGPLHGCAFVRWQQTRDPGVVTAARAGEPAPEHPLVLEPEPPRGACRRHVADDRAPREPGETQFLEREVDDGAPGLAHQSLTAMRGRAPVADLGFAAVRVPGDPVQSDHAGQYAVVPDRPDRLDAVRPPARDELDEIERVLPRVGARHRGPPRHL